VTAKSYFAIMPEDWRFNFNEKLAGIKSCSCLIISCNLSPYIIHGPEA